MSVIKTTVVKWVTVYDGHNKSKPINSKCPEPFENVIFVFYHFIHLIHQPLLTHCVCSVFNVQAFPRI